MPNAQEVDRMVTIPIQTEEEVLVELEEIARGRQITVQEVAKEALLHYLRQHTSRPSPYSFIGIWHSGKRSISQEVEAALEQGINRHKGWSMAE
jgi:hypothetical protein